MEAFLTCSICTKALDEPKTLPCFHSFCKICLAGYIVTERENARKKGGAQHLFTCPTCRTKFEPEKGNGAEQITPANCFINHMLGIQQQTQKFPCESCKAHVSVTCRCVECERYLCENCLKIHNNWPDFEQHVVMTLEELARPENHSKVKKKPGLCLKRGHGNKPYEFYCNICQEVACINCVVLDQPSADHSYQSVDTVAEKHKKSLKTTSDILQKTSRDVQTSLREIDQATHDLEANTKRAKDMVLQQEKEILQELTDRVKEKTTTLLRKIDEQHQGVIQKLEEQHDEIKAYHERVNGSLNFAMNIFEKASNEEIILLGTEIQVNANDIKKECPEMMESIHDGDIEYDAKSTESVLGNVKLNDLGNVGMLNLKSILSCMFK